MRTKKWFFLASSLAILSLLWTSCAPAVAPTPLPKTTPLPAKAPVAETPAPKPAAPSPTPKPAAEQPNYGGTLTMIAHADPPDLDVQRQTILALFGAAGPAYSGILQYDPFQNDKIIGDLAERWEASPDGTTYTFYFHKGVKWHDGKPFTSLDAKFSLERYQDFSGLKVFVKGIKTIETPDANTLKVILERPNAAFTSQIAHGRILMAPKHVVDAKGSLRRDVVGTGPYKHEEYVSSLGTKLVKNPDYFIKGRPYLDRINSYIISDVSTRLAAFRAGRVKMIGMPPDQPLTLAQSEAVKKEMPQAAVLPYRALNGWAIPMNTTKPPWDDVRVRRAAFLAIDRQKALQVVAEGVGELGLTFIYGEYAVPEAELLKMPGYRQPKDQDIAEAKRLLAEAGHEKGFKSSINVRAGYAMYEKVAIFAKDQLAKVGIDLQLNVLEFASYLDRANRLAFDTMSRLDPLTIEDPGVSDRDLTLKMGGFFATMDDPKLMELYDKQAAAMDVNERKKLVYEIQYRVAEIATHIFFFWSNGFLAMAPDVRGYKPGIGTHNNYKLQEVWLAK